MPGNLFKNSLLCGIYRYNFTVAVQCE
jgi:hypothetical protein